MSTTKTYPKDLEALLEYFPDISPTDKSIIERAYHRAEAAHDGQKRKSGEPFFYHPVAVASILAELRLDAEAIAAALLHDVVEDTEVTREDIEAEFGETITRLVDGVTKLKNLPNEANGQKSDSNRQAKSAESLRKMLLTMDDDVRVVLVKLADRLHNMRTLGFMSEDRQKKTAQETLDIYAPLANRLGIWQIKWELEDISFRYLQNYAYKEIARNLDEKRIAREQYVKEIADKLRSELEKYGITNAQITARPKHIYSIYKKMKRKDLPLEQIYDIRAIRVIVDEVPQCYVVLGIVHGLWRPIKDEFDDYIAAPKDNFYKSLHTAVMDEHGKTVEVQIRTRRMHEDAEYGIAAHWRYKEGRRSGAGKKDKGFEDRVAYLRKLMNFDPENNEEDAVAFISRVREEVFEDRVYVFTPDGDVNDLPVGATPIDFAYQIHTEIGHRCRGAKVHGKLVSLNYRLKTGDQVEIITSKRGGPSMDWLNEDLGYVKTTRARQKIRLWFKRQRRDQHISFGRAALERELKRLGVLDKLSFDEVASLLGFDKSEDLLAAIGAGDVNGSQITQKVLEDERRKRDAEKTEIERFKPRVRQTMGDASQGVNIMGTSGLLVNMASCCNPAPGDNITGYVTRGRGVTVHRKDCGNLKSITDTERLVEVTWGSVSEGHMYVVPIEVIAQDREGLLKDISTIIANEKINITALEVTTRQQIATLHLSLELRNTHQLPLVLDKISGIASVYETRRVNSG